jgi:hypothetical protein
MTNREIDALVAENVMGWILIPREKLGWGIPPGRPHLVDEVKEIPHYSTDIAAAWEVVEKMTENPEPHFELSKDRAGWHAGFDPDRPFKRVTAKATTAPLAICLARLDTKAGFNLKVLKEDTLIKE